MKFSIAHVALGAIVCLGSLSLSLAEEVNGVNGHPAVDHPVATERALQGISKDENPFKNVDQSLSRLYFQYMPATITEPILRMFRSGGEEEHTNWMKNLKVDMQEGRVAIEIITAGGGDIVQGVIDELSPLGFQPIATYRHIASGTFPIASIPLITGLQNLNSVRPVIAKTNVGSVTSQGIEAMQAVFLQMPPYSLTGTGLTVGVISDSYNRLNGAAVDISTDDLPGFPQTQVLKEGFDSDYTDEGRAMMQLIYDVAPGVNLIFHTGEGGLPGFVTGVKALATAGCDIIVDDLGYPFEPFFQDGLGAQAVDEVVAQGIPYFSSAGNQQEAYFSSFNPTGGKETIGDIEYTSFHDFGQGNQFMNFSAVDGTNEILLQWDEPYLSAYDPQGAPGPSCSKDIDIFIYDAALRLFDKSTNANIGNDPTEYLMFDSEGPQTYFIRIGVYKESLPPGFIKLVRYSGELGIKNAGSSFGHAIAAGGAGVGAADWRFTPTFGTNPPVIEDFSSAGDKNPIFFDMKGNRLVPPDVRNQPRFSGPDSTSTTFFGEQLLQCAPNFCFSGTSASAPHVAGVVALLLEFDNTLTPHDIYKLLEETAVDMDDPRTMGFDTGFDFKTGYGLVNATAALEKLLSKPPPTLKPEGSKGKGGKSKGGKGKGGKSKGGKGKGKRALVRKPPLTPPLTKPPTMAPTPPP